jgi:dipeptidyl aminopeptidase/acylaminoacyl peptidase
MATAAAGPVAVSPLPELGPGRPVAPGVVLHEVALTTGGRPGDGQVWVYLPEKRPAKPLPAVLIGPAGSTLIWGMALGEGDQAEHIPYALAGFAVVAYAISGPVADDEFNNRPAMLAGVQEFRDAEAGLVDARRAFDYLAAKVPAIDARRVFSSGHSSAATLSLLFAENEPRLAGCIAYAPCTDVEKRLNNGIFRVFNPSLPGYADFIRESSPRTHADKLHCPLFLFHADDDTNLPVADTVAFARQVQQHNKDVTFSRVSRGGHYDSMIQQGVPRAIRWLLDHTAKVRP